MAVQTAKIQNLGGSQILYNDLRKRAASADGNLADEYSASQTYAVGDFVMHLDKLYRCKTAITTAEAWTAAHWEETSMGEETSALKSALDSAESRLYDLDGKASIDLPTNKTDAYAYTGSVGSQIENSTAFTSSYAYPAIDLTAYIGAVVTVKFTTTATTSNRITALCDSSGIISKMYYEKAMTSAGFAFNVTSTNKYLYISVHKYNTSGITIEAYNNSNNVCTTITYNDKKIKKPNNILNLFEIGSMNYSNSGWTYVNSVKRLRTRQGVSVHLLEGTTIGLTNYTGYKYNAAWKNTNGGYGYIAFTQQDYVTTEEGDYVFIIAEDPEVTVSDANTLIGLIKGLENTVGYSVNDTTVSIRNNSVIPVEEYNGYVGTNGLISAQDSTKLEKYTELIPVKNGSSVYVYINFTESTGPTLFNYATYDKQKRFIERKTLLDVADSNKSYRGSIYVSDSDVAYVSIMYRSYGKGSLTVSTDDITYALFNKTKSVETDIQFLKGMINPNVNSVNHRGFNTVAPENTLPAFKMSKAKGFNIVETDVRFTGGETPVPVCLHDGTLDRTCCLAADGSAITGDLALSDLSYSDLDTYDACTPDQWATYKGTKIPSFEQFLTLCHHIGLIAYVELKGTLAQEQVDELIALVDSCGMSESVVWISADVSHLGKVIETDHKCRIGLIASSISSTTIQNAEALMVNGNNVFISSGSYSSGEITLCKNADIPLEVWTVNSQTTIKNSDPYITGFTSDTLIAGWELYLMNI